MSTFTASPSTALEAVYRQQNSPHQGRLPVVGFLTITDETNGESRTVPAVLNDRFEVVPASSLRRENWTLSIEAVQPITDRTVHIVSGI